ncbi:hypothetical protein K474DRAFT_1677898 [Panus rudis PR-1116 ss-1]|nr:hypothetical protein K474DRAFT_1677898 [Panus rudis PR-1116 ss-1]
MSRMKMYCEDTYALGETYPGAYVPPSLIERKGQVKNGELGQEWWKTRSLENSRSVALTIVFKFNSSLVQSQVAPRNNVITYAFRMARIYLLLTLFALPKLFVIELPQNHALWYPGSLYPLPTLTEFRQSLCSAVPLRVWKRLVSQPRGFYFNSSFAFPSRNALRPDRIVSPHSTNYHRSSYYPALSVSDVLMTLIKTIRRSLGLFGDLMLRLRSDAEQDAAQHQLFDTGENVASSVVQVTCNAGHIERIAWIRTSSRQEPEARYRLVSVPGRDGHRGASNTPVMCSAAGQTLRRCPMADDTTSVGAAGSGSNVI